MPWAVQSFYSKAEYKVITKSCIRWCWPNQKWFMWLWQYNVFSSVWKYSVCCKCLRAPSCHGYSSLGVYVGRGDIHHAHFSYNLLAEALHAVQFLALAMTAESLGLPSAALLSYARKQAHIVSSTKYSSGLYGNAQLDSEKRLRLCIAKF